MKANELRKYVKKDVEVELNDGEKKTGVLKNYNSKSCFLMENVEEEAQLQRYSIVDIAAIKLL